MAFSPSTVASVFIVSREGLSRSVSNRTRDDMIWAVAFVGLISVGFCAYREYFAENEDEQGEGSLLTNVLFIFGVAVLVCVGLYGAYLMLS